MNAIKKFYDALQKFDVQYNSETGYLSKTIIILAYKSERRIVASRLFIFSNFFLIFYEDDIRKIKFENVVGFRLKDKIVR